MGNQTTLRIIGDSFLTADTRIVYTGGTFDLFHAGHVNFLDQCRTIAGPDGKVVVSLNTDEFITAYKGKPPVMTYQEREAVLQSCYYVDQVIPNTGGSDSKPAILSIKPNFIVIGDDWAKKDYYAQMSFTQEWLDENGIVLIYVPYMKGISTTSIKERILANA
jgi:glycerol-3-phosphate cytidylyltransferase